VKHIMAEVDAIDRFPSATNIKLLFKHD